MLGALTLPAAAQAGDTASTADRQDAAQECRFERGTTAATREAFALKYGTNDGQAKRVRQVRLEGGAPRERPARAGQDHGAANLQDRGGDHSGSKAAFALKYGTNSRAKNAFGKCVSAKAHELKQQADDRDRKDATARNSAAKQCDQERGITAASRAAFTDEYGTGTKRTRSASACPSSARRLTN